MIRLRPYKPSDAWYLLKWWEGADEESFLKWSAGKFSYPLTIEQLDCYFSKWALEEENGFLMTALDENGVPVGHFLLKSADYKKGEIGMGHIVVNPAARGRGLGKAMMEAAKTYVFGTLLMERLTLYVFENNPGARVCYEAAGFSEKEVISDYVEYRGKPYEASRMEVFR